MLFFIVPGASGIDQACSAQSPTEGTHILDALHLRQQVVPVLFACWKSEGPPHPVADLVGIKAQLDQQGHLSEEAFDHFVAEGKLRIASELQ